MTQTVVPKKLKIRHWVMMNKSGMNRVAESIAAAEKVLGMDSEIVNCQDPAVFDANIDADIHVSHTHVPDYVRKKCGENFHAVWIGHGTPEHVFATSIEADANRNMGAQDGIQLMQNWLRTADAIVTFWPRHQWIYQSICDKNTIVDCVPLGVDKTFWKPVQSRGKYLGTPSLLTAENGHQIKWPLDLFIAWPSVAEAILSDARLHAEYLPNDQHRWYFPLLNRNGCSYSSVITSMVLDPENLRNAFCSVDYYIGLVRYGDHNRICLEANACGTKTISYAGNPYSDFWITEGDQRQIAQELIEILTGKVKPRDKTPVPDILDTAKAMIEIYKRILEK